MKPNGQKTKLTVLKNVPGLIKAKLEHTIASTEGECTYEGPKIPKGEWEQMLAYFKWCYDRTKSECQVRLFVNPALHTWRVWAFPQEASTGMSAREIEGDSAKKQREQFPDSEGWIYFGTVHHHCSCTAFQSTVDEANEVRQDGLHITIGKMDSDHYDMHCRFYLGGTLYSPDMALFWDIGDQVRALIPAALQSNVAIYQMTTPTDSVLFPDKWKENLIERIVPAQTPTDWRGSGTGSYYGDWTPTGGSTRKSNWERANDAVDYIESFAVTDAIGEFMQCLHYLDNDTAMKETFRLLKRHEVDADDILRRIRVRGDKGVSGVPLCHLAMKCFEEGMPLNEVQELLGLLDEQDSVATAEEAGKGNKIKEKKVSKAAGEAQKQTPPTPRHWSD